jgi:hypothetical protein
MPYKGQSAVTPTDWADVPKAHRVSDAEMGRRQRREGVGRRRGKGPLPGQPRCWAGVKGTLGSKVSWLTPEEWLRCIYKPEPGRRYCGRHARRFGGNPEYRGEAA